MPTTKKSPAKPSARPSTGGTARARAAKDDRAIRRVAKSLDAAQKDLAAIGSSLGTGAGDLRKDVAKLIRDARRDVAKMGSAVRRDLEHLQKDVTAASKAKPRRAAPAASSTKPRAAKPRAAKPRAARARRKSA